MRNRPARRTVLGFLFGRARRRVLLPAALPPEPATALPCPTTPEQARARLELAATLREQAFVVRRAVLDFVTHAGNMAEYRDAAAFLHDDFEKAFTAFLDAPTVPNLTELLTVWKGWSNDFDTLAG